MNYYEQLKVSKDATKMEIKKAYFKIVKQYPPEKYPEEFIKYRKAYEILFDENTREQYDKLEGIPEQYKASYEMALEAMEYGDYDEAIRLLKEISVENPELKIITGLLGEIYLENENSGNAIKIFEQLVELEPKNAVYQGKLAEAYTMRKYTKKAIVQFEKSLEMDPDNPDYWAGLSHAYAEIKSMDKATEILMQGQKRLEETQSESLKLDLYAISFYIRKNDIKKIREKIEKVKKIVEKDSSLVEYVENTVDHYMDWQDIREEWAEGYYHLIHFLAEITKKEEYVTLGDHLEKSYILSKLDSDQKILEVIVGLTEHTLIKCDCTSCKIRESLIQFSFFEDVISARKSLRHLKKEYPDYYDFNKGFYDEFMNPKKEVTLAENITKKMLRYQKKYPMEYGSLIQGGDIIQKDMLDSMGDEFPDLLDFEEFYRKEEPYVREEAKVGRNDPCPCGSGKKYKRCCGR